MASATIPGFKRGSTFDFSATGRLPTGTWSAVCKIRTERGVLVAELTVEITPPLIDPGDSVIRIYTDDSTAGWPLGVHKLDALFTEVGGYKLPSKTSTIEVVELESHG